MARNDLREHLYRVTRPGTIAIYQTKRIKPFEVRVVGMDWYDGRVSVIVRPVFIRSTPSGGEAFSVSPNSLTIPDYVNDPHASARLLLSRFDQLVAEYTELVAAANAAAEDGVMNAYDDADEVRMQFEELAESLADVLRDVLGSE